MIMYDLSLFWNFIDPHTWETFFLQICSAGRLGERPELEEAAQALEQRARGWLETDEARMVNWVNGGWKG